MVCKRQGERKKSEPVLIDDEHSDGNVTARAEELLHTEYGRRAISEYINEHLNKDGVCCAEDWNFCDDKVYIMNMPAVIHSRDGNEEYSVEVFDRTFAQIVKSKPVPRRDRVIPAGDGFIPATLISRPSSFLAPYPSSKGMPRTA